MLCVGSLLLLESIVFPYSQLEENERLCPWCAWIPKTARTLLKARTSFFNVCYGKAPRSNCVKIGEVFGTQPESSCLLGHCYLFLHQVSLQHVQGLFRLLLRVVPVTWTIFVGVKRGVEKGTRRQPSAFILGRSKCCRFFFFYDFLYSKTNPQAALSFSAWLLILVCSFLTFHSSFAETRTEVCPSFAFFFFFQSCSACMFSMQHL